MKPLYILRVILCSLFLFFSLSSATYGQCAENEYAKYLSYDTLLLGGGNDLFNFKFPQFDPTLGTLIKVDIELVTTVKISYNLENIDEMPVVYKVRAIRTDDIMISGLQTPLSNIEQKVANTHNLSGFDGVIGSGTDFVSKGPIYAFNKFRTTQSIEGDVAPFLGIDSVTIDYISVTSSYPFPGSNYLYHAIANDSIGFKLIYYYCSTTFLPANIRNFTVTKRSAENVQLNWYVPSDKPGNRYDIQKSMDGKTFSVFKSIVSVSNTGSNYQVNYTPVREDKSKIFFRIRQRDESGAITYSSIRGITLRADEQVTMKVYPTIVTNMVNIYFPGKSRDDWQVNLIALSGQLVQQAQFPKTNFIKWPIKDQVAKGFYVVEAINKKTLESQRSKIIIQR